MDDIKLVDVYKVISKKNNKDYLVVSLYSLKSKCLVKLLKEYNEDHLNNLREYLDADVSPYIKTTLSSNGVVRLDLDI